MSLRMILMGVLVLAGSVASAQDAKSVLAKSQSAIVSVLAGDSQGTGFAIGDGSIILTCHHVIDSDPDHISIKTDKEIPAKLIANSADYDVAILKIDKPLSGHLSLLEGNLPDTGSKIYVIGSPLGLEKSITEGIVSSVRKDDSISLVQITAPISHGSSGSPILSESGQVIGMVQLTLSEGQGLNFGMSAANLREVVSGKVGSTKFESKAKKAKNSRRYVTSNGEPNFKQMVEDIKGDDYDLRWSANDAAKEIGPSMIPKFLQYLEKTSKEYPDFDNEATHFVRIYGEDGKPYLLSALKGPSKLSRLIAAKTITSILISAIKKETYDHPIPGYGDDPWIYGDDVKSAMIAACDDSEEHIQACGFLTCAELHVSTISQNAEAFLRQTEHDRVDRCMVLASLCSLEVSKVLTLENAADDLIGSKANDLEDPLSWIESFQTDTSLHLIKYIMYGHAGEGESDVKTRVRALESLGKFEKQSAIDVIFKALEDKSPKVRGEALTSIGKTTGDKYISMLVVKTKDPDSDVVCGAIAGLGFTYSPKAYDELERLGEHLDKSYLSWIIYAMNVLGDIRAIPFVEKHLKDDDKDVREQAESARASLIKIRDAKKKG